MVLPAHIPHLSLTEGVARLPLTARDILTRPPTGKHFSPATPSDCFTIDFPRRATSPGEGLRFALLLFTDKGRSQVVLDCAHRTSTFLSCAFDASKKDTWLRPSSPSWLLQKQSHPHLLPLDPGPAEGFDDLPSQHFRHFHQ